MKKSEAVRALGELYHEPKQATHTPGPWHITAFVRETDEASPTGRRARIVTECDSADGFLIAGGTASVADVQRRGGLADARLIAAAPDMLAALQAFVEYGHCRQDNVHDRRNSAEMFRRLATRYRPLLHALGASPFIETETRPTLDAARAAIAKATGGEGR